MVLVIYLLATLAAVSPYYLEYYNEFVGPKQAYDARLFGLGQAGGGIDAAASYLNEKAAPNSSVQLFVRPKHVVPPLRPDLQEINQFVPKFLSSMGDNENWDMTSVLPQADYLVENIHFRLYMNESFHTVLGQYTLVHTVEVQGAPLAWVYKRG